MPSGTHGLGGRLANYASQALGIDAKVIRQANGIATMENTASRSTQLFDRSEALDRLSGDTYLLDEIIHMFVRDWARRKQALRQGLESTDARAIEIQAHSIRGAAANISANLLSSKAAYLEKIAHCGDWRLLHSLSEDLDHEFERLLAVLPQSPKNTTISR